MIHLFFIALQFLTRIPVPWSQQTTDEDIGKSTAFFPLIGIIIGAGGALVYLALRSYLPETTCVLAVIIYSAFITNGFHEDGLADSFDGFGGGWTKENVLHIMRDSRLGTYGTLGLIFLVLTKYNLLSTIEEAEIWRWLIIAHTASRWTVLPLSRWLPYARAEGQGKLVARRVGWFPLMMATVTFIGTLTLLPLPVACMAFATTGVIVILSGLYYRSRLDGITGDCLGATNQLTEVGIYLVAVIVFQEVI